MLHYLIKAMPVLFELIKTWFTNIPVPVLVIDFVSLVVSFVFELIEAKKIKLVFHCDVMMRIRFNNDDDTKH
ncbi:hypothetical protein [Photobacterium alginatilyticum]|uniref:Uncharacterized protein n=1 Tax=Photobacterium alginatilyticum TaxID=1775171 RepID=A0ABW9YJN6_9GAMM|nr:hypothetical protein [Photobacterium alginatilyticum]NBI54012.1 hypothetical protein [Photobacterium alginatilyticum]